MQLLPTFNATEWFFYLKNNSYVFSTLAGGSGSVNLTVKKILNGPRLQLSDSPKKRTSSHL